MAPFSIIYDASNAVVADIKIHTVNYKVESVKYPSLMTLITDSFAFEITCPDDLSTISVT